MTNGYGIRMWHQKEEKKDTADVYGEARLALCRCWAAVAVCRAFISEVSSWFTNVSCGWTVTFPHIFKIFWRFGEFMLCSLSLNIRSIPWLYQQIQPSRVWLLEHHQPNKKSRLMVQSLWLGGRPSQTVTTVSIHCVWEGRSQTSLTEMLFQGTYLVYKWILRGACFHP